MNAHEKPQHRADAVLGRLARAQAGVFTRADAIAAGVTASEVRRRVRDGLWVPQFGSALRAATTPDTIDARERAAIARAGAGAALSHFSAGRRWGLSLPDSAEVWLTVPHHRTLRPTRGLRVVRSRHLTPTAVRRVDGVPVLEPARTLADLAGCLDERQLTAVLLEALQRRLCTHDQLVAWHRDLAGRPGMALFANVIEVADPAFESILAAEFGQLMRRANVALVASFPLRLPTGEQVVCDFADLHARIDFEVDGSAYHSTPAQVARDKARDRRLSRSGWIAVRYGTDDIRRRPTQTLADVLNQIAQRLRSD
ncbi:MAG TPA: type IV toxin-antitoxin system AbiEi family antitoxin domain-containing protein [Micromonosporaceae bacterium]|jgi:very-short-patch-repair endonuclease